MIDKLPLKIHYNESGIVNLDKDSNNGTHWVAYIKTKNNIKYFDSFGNLKPPPQLINYFNSNGIVNIKYNYSVFQKFNTYHCGHLCLRFLNQ